MRLSNSWQRIHEQYKPNCLRKKTGNKDFHAAAVRKMWHHFFKSKRRKSKKRNLSNSHLHQIGRTGKSAMKDYVETNMKYKLQVFARWCWDFLEFSIHTKLLLRWVQKLALQTKTKQILLQHHNQNPNCSVRFNSANRSHFNTRNVSSKLL